MKVETSSSSKQQQQEETLNPLTNKLMSSSNYSSVNNKHRIDGVNLVLQDNNRVE